MEKEFIPYEQALVLKELGFDEPCFGFYNDMDNNKPTGGNFPCDGRNSAPLYQQAFRWFREKYEIKSDISFSRAYSNYRWHYIRPRHIVEYYCHSGFEAYEEAEFECLKKLIEIVKEQK